MNQSSPSSPRSFSAGLRRLILLLVLPSLLICHLPAAGKHIVVAGNLDYPRTMDPAEVWDDVSAFFTFNIFDNLVVYDFPTRKIVPCLALSWTEADNGRVWEFELRRGVRFHDNTPFNADAVLFTFQRQMDARSPYRFYPMPMFEAIFTELVEVQKLGEYRVAFRLKRPFAPFLATLTADCAAIVSPTAVMRYGREFPRHPVGTGPFRLKEWRPNTLVTLEANPDYWRGRPEVDEFVMQIEPNYASLENKFINGKIDFMIPYSISRLVGLRNLSWVKVQRVPALSVTYLAFNLQRPLLKNREVRRALLYLWDPRHLKLTMQETALPLPCILPSEILGVPTAPPTLYTFSMERAEQILKQERVPRNTILTYITTQASSTLPMVLMGHYAKNLKKVGINLVFKRVSDEEYSRRIARGDFDLTMSGWTADFPDPDSMLYPLVSKKLQEQGFANMAGAEAAPILQMIDAARQERDAHKRLQLYRTINRRISEDALLFPLYQATIFYIYNSRLHTFPEHNLGRFPLFDLRKK